MIIFKKLRWKNFLSTGNTFTEITLNDDSSTLIVGSNGSGKSTMLDALCFSLFGKPFRNINKAQLINAVNQRDAVIEVEFETSNKQYKIIRGIKPNIFEIYCEGNLVNQNAATKDYQEYLEKFILKLNYKSFTQIVILGSASFTPFMQLSTADRRSIIEDLLDIQIFSRMNGVLKDRFSTLKDELTTGKNHIEVIKEKIEVQSKYIANIQKDKENKILLHNEQIDNEKSNIETLTKTISKLQEEIDTITLSVNDEQSIKTKIRKYENLKSNLDKTYTKIETDISFYEVNSECPTCKQNLPVQYKETMIDERKEKLEKVALGIKDIESKHDEVVQRLTHINHELVKISRLNRKLSDNQNQVIASQRYIESIRNEIDRIKNKSDDIEIEQTKIQDLIDEKTRYDSTVKELTEQKTYYELAATLLKDTGIKTKIVRQYVPIINKLVNKYLSTMDFFVNFNLDESFKETIKSRHRDEFSYESFSEGEKQRIDMALMLTWRTVAKMKNSANTNLLILDEVFDSSLDTNGTEDLMKILGLLESTNLFVISHKGDILQEKFRTVIKFEKVNNFSRIIK